MPLWEAPAAFWLGLTIPAVILLWVLRPHRQRRRVPSLLLWSPSPAERQSARPWQRLRNHPLLWLQVLVALLLMLAAARPFTPAEAAGRQQVVFLDASGSMQAADLEPTRFAAAVAAVVDLARAMGPGQRMTVIRLDGQPRVLVTGADSPQRVESALSGQQPTDGPADLAAAAALAAGIVQGSAEWVLVSDGGLELAADLRRPADSRFRFVAIGSPAANLAVTGLVARRQNDSVSLQAGLRNTGRAPVSGRLQLLAGDQLVGARAWELSAGGETYLTWSGVPAAAGWYQVRLSGVPAAYNALALDDQAWAALPGGDEPGVLLVSAGSSFLERILTVHGGIRTFRATPADWPALAAQGSAYPLTVLDRVWPASPPPGNALLVGPPRGDEFQPRQVWPRSDHPLLRHVDWSEVQVARARRLLPADGTDPGSTGDLGTGWETVIDSDGGPLLAVRAQGSRREALLAFALSDSDLPLRPAFPVLMANLLDWLLPQPGLAPQVLLPGAAATVSTAPLASAVWVEDAAAAGERHELAPPWPPQPFRPPAPGLYRVVHAGTGFRQEQLLVANGYHPREADLTPITLDIPAADGAGTAPARGARAFWPWLIAVVLLASLAEWWVDARGR